MTPSAERYYADHPGLVSHHESGHAVVATALGLRVTRVTINRIADEGATHAHIEDPRHQGVIFAAGELAERRSRSWHPGLRSVYSDTDTPDRRGLLAAVDALGWPRSRRVELETEADAILTEHRAELAALAGELERRRELDGAEARRILAGAGVFAGR